MYIIYPPPTDPSFISTVPWILLYPLPKLFFHTLGETLIDRFFAVRLFVNLPTVLRLFLTDASSQPVPPALETYLYATSPLNVAFVKENTKSSPSNVGTLWPRATVLVVFPSHANSSTVKTFNAVPLNRKSKFWTPRCEFWALLIFQFTARPRCWPSLVTFPTVFPSFSHRRVFVTHSSHNGIIPVLHFSFRCTLCVKEKKKKRRHNLASRYRASLAFEFNFKDDENFQRSAPLSQSKVLEAAFRILNISDFHFTATRGCWPMISNAGFPTRRDSPFVLMAISFDCGLLVTYASRTDVLIVIEPVTFHSKSLIAMPSSITPP